MRDPADIVLSCDRWEEIVAAYNLLIDELELGVRRRLGRIFSNLIAQHDIEGAFQLLNNRTVADILAEYEGRDSAPPIASGERDGVRWQLHGGPDERSATD